jgi:hypothetical protein
MGHIQGVHCHEVIIFPERLDDDMTEDHPVHGASSLGRLSTPSGTLLSQAC